MKTAHAAVNPKSVALCGKVGVKDSVPYRIFAMQGQSRYWADPATGAKRRRCRTCLMTARAALGGQEKS